MLRNSSQATDELKQLNAQIAERKKYYRDQEKVINETVETGNTQLMGLNHDIALASKQLRDLKTDIRTSIQDKKLLNEDLSSMRKEAKYLLKQPGMATAYAL